MQINQIQEHAGFDIVFEIDTKHCRPTILWGMRNILFSSSDPHYYDRF